jgi:threonine/homoserine/homoserine lactone efflux protein
MDWLSVLPAFLVAVLVISVSPGPAMALILRRAALRGTRAAVPTVLGLEVGLYVWALAAGAGFASLVATSEAAYTALRVIGAVVLLTLGVTAWRAALAEHSGPEAALPGAGSHRPGVAFGEGLLVQLANPKAAVFMFAFYPQFVPADGSALALTAALAGIQVALETTLYLGLAAAVGRAAGWFRRPKIRRRLEMASGTVLVAMGLRVALASR